MKNTMLKRFLWVLTLLSFSLNVYAGEIVRIMPLGDSITHEAYRDDAIDASTPDVDRSAYRNDLWSLLQNSGYAVDFVGSLSSGENVIPSFDFHHEGWDGLTDAQMASNVYQYLTDNSADIVLLHIGTNGVITDNGALDVENTLKEIDRYETDNNTHVKVILARIINCWKDWDYVAAGETYDACTDTTINEITTFNNNVMSMANARIANGDDIVIVDMENGASFAYDVTDMIDDLHPNDAGYAKMANVWYEALESNIPTHQWKLEEATQPYIDTYRDANGACVTDCPTQTTGIFGNAQEFDGSNDEVNVVDDGTFDWGASDSFTVEFWMKPNATTDLQVAVGRHKGTSGNGSWWVGREGSKVRLSIGENITSAADIDTTGTQWTHVVAIKDVASNQIKLYINGAEDTSTAILSSVNFVGSEPLNLGWFETQYWFDGVLDEMTIYNGVLSADQIKQHFDAGIGEITLAITSTPVTSAEVNAPYSYDVNSNDPSATFSLTNNPGWMDINDTSTGVITGTPTTVGNDDVTVSATNGVQTVNQSFVVKVRDTASLPSTMSHYWKLNESTGATTYIDEYNPNTDATCNTGCPTQVVGKVDEAQDFNGVNSDLDVPNDPSIDWGASESFTIEYWMKANALPGTSNTVHFGRYNGTMAWWIGTNTSNNAVMFFRDSDNIDVQFTGPVINTNTWYHISVVRDAGNTFKFYVNGQEVNTGTDITTGNFNGTVPITIGYFIDSTTSSEFNFDGVLDDIAIFNSALPANEIDAHYKNGSAGYGFDNFDTIAPVITLLGTTPIDVAQGSVYTDAGATALDDRDGDITANIVTVNPVDTATLGQYTVTYNVTDSAGNTAAEVSRTVNVVDGAAPVITLLGTTPIDVAQGSVYTDAGATALDDVDGDITANIVTVNPVDTATLGQYTVTYNVTDSAGNTAAEVSRTVNVVDGAAPVITLLGTTPIDVAQGSVYTDAGATALDDVDGDITANIVTVNPVDTATLGQYTVTYNVTDSAGNTAAEVSRTVNVVDASIPIITLLGTTPIDVAQGSVYTDAGATALDDVDGDITANIVTVNPVDTATLGQYTVTYNVTDSAGNTAAEVSRTVNVVVADNGTGSSGGGCTYNPNSKNFDMTFLLMMALGLFYPFRRRFIK